MTRRGNGPEGVRRVHPLSWLWESLVDDATFVLGSMFGTKAVYLDGLLVLCFAGKKEPWRGILVCTGRPQHPSLMAELPALRPHPILGKWLYLPESADDFEAVAGRLVDLARRRDPRIGIIPGRNRKDRP